MHYVPYDYSTNVWEIVPALRIGRRILRRSFRRLSTMNFEIEMTRWILIVGCSSSRILRPRTFTVYSTHTCSWTAPLSAPRRTKRSRVGSCHSWHTWKSALFPDSRRDSWHLCHVYVKVDINSDCEMTGMETLDININRDSWHKESLDINRDSWHKLPLSCECIAICTLFHAGTLRSSRQQ